MQKNREISAVPRRAESKDLEELAAIWLRSVQATHTFLTDQDIEFFQPLVRKGLKADETWVVEANDIPIGFMIIDGVMVEALFIDPAHSGKGLGTLLLSHARKLRGGAPLCVDVNEQNPAALAFYLSRGFKQVGRSPVDSAGRPFPLLHLAMEEDHA